VRVRFLLFLLLDLATASGAFGASHHYVDCSAAAGNGTLAHPWNSVAVLSGQVFAPGDVTALRRGTQCDGSLALHGSGSESGPIRLTAYGEGRRPKIVASNKDRQALLLANAGYWQIDSLDISGGNTFGLLVTGDRDRVQSHITLRNLRVHDVEGGELKSKDSGLVVFLRGANGQRFEHVLIENVVATQMDTIATLRFATAWRTTYLEMALFCSACAMG